MSSSKGDPRNDLIEDRAIRSADSDLLGREDFAAQAAKIIQVVPTPANVAIYAPWGSGKTSLGNLLAECIDQQTVGFIQFDAFKYAEAPLRRTFIKSVAKELGISDRKFKDGLYDEENDSKFDLRPTSVTGFIGTTALVLALFLAIAAILALVLAGLDDAKGSFGSHWTTHFGVLIPALFAPAILVALIIAVVNNQLTVNRKRSAPHSDEQFEDLFRQIVEQKVGGNSKWKRLIVFIDELDRCSPDEVASTLETLRTFLEVDNCVFVVAADRAVLESAVAKRARQDTPFNVQNPYYSAGSSYLDKIFQYQWQLPPMLPRRLTNFARSLVDGRPEGVWTEIDLDLVISVLVPLHVQSPRRIKELLNAFAMSYRLVEKRIESGQLSTTLRQRAPELAKLVCLQLEFPVFANDLPNEPRLTEFVLGLATEKLNAEQQPADVTDEVWKRAQQYAGRAIALDALIAGTGDAADAVVAGTENSDEVGDDAAKAKAPEEQIIEAQGRLLIQYLQMTETIPGPAADLIFQEGLGFAFDLPSSVAERLKSAALGNRIDEVQTITAGLSDDEKRSALRLLAFHVREDLPGIEGGNALRSLLGAVGAASADSEFDLHPVVDDLAAAAEIGYRGNELSESEIVGAICLGLYSSENVGKQLIAKAMEDELVETDEGIAAFISRHLNDFSDEQVPRLGDVVASLLVDLPWDGADEDLKIWDDGRATAVLLASKDAMLANVKAADEVASQDAAVAPAPADPSAAPVATPAEPDHAGVALSELIRVCDAAKDASRKQVLEATLELVLALDTREARDAAVGRFPALGKITSSSLTGACLLACSRRSVGDSPRWLDAISPDVIRTSPESKARLANVAAHVWPKVDVDVPDLSEFEAFSSSFRPLKEAVEWSSSDSLSDAMRLGAAVPSVNAEGLSRWSARISIGYVFEGLGIVTPVEWRASFVEQAIALLAAALPEESLRQDLVDRVLSDSVFLVDRLPLAVATQFLEACDTSPWLTPAERVLLKASIVARHQSEAEEAPLSFSVDQLIAVLDADSDPSTLERMQQAISVWMMELKPTIEAFWSVAGRYAEGTLPDLVRAGIASYSDQAEVAGRTELARLALAESPVAPVSEDFLDAIGFPSSDLTTSTDLVIEAFRRASNETHRRVILREWTALKLTDVALIRKMVSAIFNPTISLGKSGRDLVISNAQLAAGLPRGDKLALAKAIESSAESEEWEQLKPKLESAGWMKTKGNILNRRIVHLDD